MLCSIVLLLSVGSVFAQWYYSEDPPETVREQLFFNLGEFTWEGSDVLPDDIQGEDHAWLIGNLVSGKKDGEEIGLNNPTSALSEYIDNRLSGGFGWKRDYFGSMAVTGDAEMEALFGAAAEGLCFIIQVVSDTEYYIYTTSVYLGERGEPNWLGTSNKTPGNPSISIGEYIYPIFRTKLVRSNANADWDIIETKQGKALSDWYDENRASANVTQIPAFDPKSWEEDIVGTGMDNAIWTFIGDEATAYPTSKTAPVYYRITPKSGGTRQVVSYNTDCMIKVYNANGSQIAVSTAATDADKTPYQTVQWNATASTQYYISFEGSMSIHFTVA